jgi:hypothetical protein
MYLPASQNREVLIPIPRKQGKSSPVLVAPLHHTNLCTIGRLAPLLAKIDPNKQKRYTNIT